MTLLVAHPERTIIHLQLRQNEVLKTMSAEERAELEQRLDIVDVDKGDLTDHFEAGLGVEDLEEISVGNAVLLQLIADTVKGIEAIAVCSAEIRAHQELVAAGEDPAQHDDLAARAVNCVGHALPAGELLIGIKARHIGIALSLMADRRRLGRAGLRHGEKDLRRPGTRPRGRTPGRCGTDHRPAWSRA